MLHQRYPQNISLLGCVKSKANGVLDLQNLQFFPAARPTMVGTQRDAANAVCQAGPLEARHSLRPFGHFAESGSLNDTFS